MFLHSPIELRSQNADSVNLLRQRKMLAEPSKNETEFVSDELTAEEEDKIA